MPLTPKQATFVAEYLTDLNATQAAIRAGYSEQTARQIGSENLGKPEIADAIAAAMAERSARTQVTADELLTKLGRIALADPNELVAHRVGACRHCWGERHRYQFTPAEWERAEDAHEDKRTQHLQKTSEELGPLNPQGGVGFDARRAPHPDCPECHGDGVGRALFADTTRASLGARALYAGVKLTKDGMEMKLHSQLDAAEKLGRHLGLWKGEVASDVVDGLADLLRAVDGKTRGVPSQG